MNFWLVFILIIGVIFGWITATWGLIHGFVYGWWELSALGRVLVVWGCIFYGAFLLSLIAFIAWGITGGP
jgi:hypothetical protein